MNKTFYAGLALSAALLANFTETAHAQSQCSQPSSRHIAPAYNFQTNSLTEDGNKCSSTVSYYDFMKNKENPPLEKFECSWDANYTNNLYYYVHHKPGVSVWYMGDSKYEVNCTAAKK